MSTRPLRIAVLGDATSIHTATYVRALAGAGHEVHLVGDARETDLPASCVSIEPRRSWRPLPRVLWLAERAARLRSALACGPFDAVNAQYVSTDAVLASLVWRGPIVLSFWGSDLYEPQLAPRHVRLLMGRTIRRAVRVHSVSGQMTEALVSRGCRREVVHQFQYGIDLGLFAYGTREREDLIVSSRALDPFYRLDVVVRAMPLVLTARPGTRLEFFGRGPEEDRLRGLVSNLGLDESVSFRGYPPSADLAESLQRARVWVSVPPSDGLPLSLLEAMACGAVPVVADYPVFHDWFDSAHGVFVPAAEPDAVAAGILEGLRISSDTAARDDNRGKVEADGDRVTNLARFVRLIEEAAGERS